MSDLRHSTLVPPSLSILIVNWNSKDYLRRCLESIRATCADLSLQIVVVDGASYDGCAEMLAADFPEVEFVQSTENIGFGRCNNLGFQHVRGKALLLLNPDTELKSGAVQLLLQQLQKQNGMIGARLLNTDGTLQTSCVRSLPTPINQALDSELLRRLFPRSKLWGTWKAFHSQHEVEVEAISGACMLLSADSFRKVGGFRQDYFMYGEDMDLCAKIKRLGLTVWHVPKAEVIHHGGGSSSAQISQFSTVIKRCSGTIYMRKNKSNASAISYRLLQMVSALVRLSLLVIALIFWRGKKRSLWQSTQKWWNVFLWAVRLSSVRPPDVPEIRGSPRSIIARLPGA